MPPQPRHRAQAKLELEITAAEAAQEKWRGTVSGLRAAGHQARREEGILRGREVAAGAAASEQARAYQR